LFLRHGVYVYLVVFVFFLCLVASPPVLWYCWLGLLTCKNRLPCNLYYVGGDVKHCSLTHSLTSPLHSYHLRSHHLSQPLPFTPGLPSWILTCTELSGHWQLFVLVYFLYFLPARGYASAGIATTTCLSVSPSVRPSRAGIVSKRRKLAAWFLHRLVAPRL